MGARRRLMEDEDEDEAGTEDKAELENQEEVEGGEGLDSDGVFHRRRRRGKKVGHTFGRKFKNTVRKTKNTIKDVAKVAKTAQKIANHPVTKAAIHAASAAR